MSIFVTMLLLSVVMEKNTASSQRSMEHKIEQNLAQACARQMEAAVAATASSASLLTLGPRNDR